MIEHGLTDAQRTLRSRGLGGSDAGILAGAPWSSPYQLWLEKTGRTERRQEPTEAMYWGTVLEEPVARRYSEVSGLKIRRRQTAFCSKYPWMLANIDREILGDPRGPGILEVKTSGGWGGPVSSEEELPDHYFAQMQHYLSVTRRAWGAFAFLIGGNLFRTFEVMPDAEYQDRLITAEGMFWERHVLGDTPPPLTAADETFVRGQHPLDRGMTVVLCGDMATRVEQLADIRSALTHMEAEEKALRANILQAMGDASIAQVPGWGSLSWKAAKGSVKELVDMDRLKAAHPAAAADCVRLEERPGSRRFLMHPGKGVA